MRTPAEEGTVTRRAAGANGSADPARRRRRWIGCGALSLLAAAAIGLALRDDPPPDDSDLRTLPPSTASAPFRDSVVGALIEIAGELPMAPDWSDTVRSRGGTLPAHPWDSGRLDDPRWRRPELLEWMRQYFEDEAHELDRVEAALSREDIGWHSHGDGGPAAPGHGEIGSITEQLGDRALWHRARGDLAAASRDLERSLRIGERLVAEGVHSSYQLRVAGGNLSLPIAQLHSLLHDGEVDLDVESRILARTPALVREPQLARRWLEGEYRSWQRRVEEIGEGVSGMGRRGLLQKFPLSLLYKTQRTIGRVADVFRATLAEADRLPAERLFPPEVVRLPFGDDDGWVRPVLLQMNSGEILLIGLFMGLRSDLELLDRLQSEESALRLLLALRRYERLHGSLPVDLDVLFAAVPDLGSLPRDPYSREAFRYDPARRIFWSVGLDGIDGGAADWARISSEPSLYRHEFADSIWIVPRAPAGREGASPPR